MAVLACLAMTTFALLSLVLPGTELLPDRPTIPDFLAFSLIIHAFPLVGLAVIWTRPRNPVGWLFLINGLSMALAVFATEYPGRSVFVGADLPGDLFVAWLGTWAWMLGPLIALPLAILRFPDGRYHGPRWRVAARLTVGVAAIVTTALLVIPGDLESFEGHFRNPTGIPGPVGEAARSVADGGFLLLIGPAAVALASIAWRLRQGSGAERQQLKWLLYPLAVFVVAMVLAVITQHPWVWTAAMGALAAVPIGAGLAILRYRLYDVDLLINRTLVYAGLTALLGIVYVSSVLVLQPVLTPVTQGDGFAVAISTLAVAALFQPVRRRVQGIVDRRFFRSRYDARRTVDAFGTRLRHETDVDRLTVELGVLVRDTLRPASVGIWLREERR